MADYSIPNLTTAVAGFSTISPSTGKTISASVTNNALISFDFSGDISGSNPDFTVLKGDKLVLSINAFGHPFWIQTVPSPWSPSDYVTENITGNGLEFGTLTWRPNQTGTYYYVCQNHPGMTGTITVSDPVFTISASNGTVPVVNIDLSADVTGTQRGWLTGRRPVDGQVFPRGVYNK